MKLLTLYLNLKPIVTRKFQFIFVSVSAIHKFNSRINKSDKFLPKERTTFGQQKLESKGVKI